MTPFASTHIHRTVASVVSQLVLAIAQKKQMPKEKKRWQDKCLISSAAWFNLYSESKSSIVGRFTVISPTRLFLPNWNICIFHLLLGLKTKKMHSHTHTLVRVHTNHSELKGFKKVEIMSGYPFIHLLFRDCSQKIMTLLFLCKNTFIFPFLLRALCTKGLLL